MLRRWFAEGIGDSDTFRRRFRWALAFQWFITLGGVILILLT